jgi:hypothetical protein
LQTIFGGQYTLSGVEVCKWFDPATLTDRPARLCRYPELADPSAFNVHICKP